ncbi:VRR-NUC domain-containing protein [Alginatibacterium sediminis]|uniref:phosphodiesterase I n=1 Tax=Alginatibacterium sediminis TaxID=2164068 RepID=A0A420ELF2_9ALTE|nr:VRR-NUC domain-containing protein [Alginatibacterium sediminis]RKF21509.1 VRR-NUC domain-containing protein [Alginatibacterium sediminis]
MINFDSQQHYYWLHFWALIDSVELRLGDLFNAQQSQWISKLRALPFNSQLLYIRLLQRKPIVFAQHKLKYPEIDELDTAIEFLEQSQLILISKASWSPYCECLTKLELLSCIDLNAEQLKPLKKLAKAEFHLALKQLPIKANTPYTILELKDNPWLQFQAWYFENSRQQLSEFVLTDIGQVSYEDYRVDRKSRLWQNSQQLSDYWQLLLISSNLELAISPSDEQVTWLQKARFDLSKLRSIQKRCLDLIAREHERQTNFELALQLYAISSSDFAKERQARIHIQLTNYSKAKQCLIAYSSPQANDGLQRFARAFAFRQRKHLDMEISAPVRYQVEIVQLEWFGSDLGPEQQALAQLGQFGWQGWHLENSLVNSIFGLSFWTVFFANIPGAFSHPYQRRPHDLYSPDFCRLREQQLAQAWRLFESEDWLEHLLTCYRQKHSIANPWVDWNRMSVSILTTLVSTIPKLVWRQLFQRLWLDLRHYRSGMPDLFVYKDGRYCWFEVKSPSDSLANHQRDWLQFLRQQLNQNAFVLELRADAPTLKEQCFEALLLDP